MIEQNKHAAAIQIDNKELNNEMIKNLLSQPYFTLTLQQLGRKLSNPCDVNNNQTTFLWHNPTNLSFVKRAVLVKYSLSKVMNLLIWIFVGSN